MKGCLGVQAVRDGRDKEASDNTDSPQQLKQQLQGYGGRLAPKGEVLTDLTCDVSKSWTVQIIANYLLNDVIILVECLILTGKTTAYCSQ